MTQYPNAVTGYWRYAPTSHYPIVGPLNANVLDDFEDGRISEYGGQMEYFDVQKEDVLRGRYSLKSSRAGASIGDSGDDFPTPRTDPPTEYRALMHISDPGTAAFLVSVQSERRPFENCYKVVLDPEDDNFWLIARIDGSNDTLEYTSIEIEDDTTYQPFITLGEEGINGGLRDRHGRELFRTEPYQERRLTGGGIGWRSMGSWETIFDHATYYPGSLGDLWADEDRIDGFEDANHREYRVEELDPFAFLSTTPASSLIGSYGLEMQDSGMLFMHPDKKSGYIRDGVETVAHINPLEVTDATYSIILSPTFPDSDYFDNEPLEHFYRVELLMDTGQLRIRKHTEGEEYTLDGIATDTDAIAETPEGTIDWEADTWYRVRMDLEEGPPSIHVIVEEHATTDQLAFAKQQEDREYLDERNGFGFACSDGGHWYIDEIREL